MATYKEVIRYLPRIRFTRTDTDKHCILVKKDLEAFLKELSKRYTLFAYTDRGRMDVLVMDNLGITSISELKGSDPIEACRMEILLYMTDGFGKFSSDRYDVSIEDTGRKASDIIYDPWEPMTNPAQFINKM